MFVEIFNLDMFVTQPTSTTSQTSGHRTSVVSITDETAHNFLCNYLNNLFRLVYLPTLL